MYYVYEWYVIETNEVFYVGKGKNKRYLDTKKRNKFFLNFFKTHNCSVRKIYENLTEQEAFQKEIDLIKHYKTNTCFRLTNQTSGGEGSSGMVVTDEFREKMRSITMGKNNPNYGNRWSKKQKQVASERAKNFNYDGKNNPNYGNKWNQEQKERLSRIRKNNPKYIGEKHGRAKKWIVLETGHVATCKKEIKKIILNLPKISTNYHYKELNDDLLNESIRLKCLLEILKNKQYQIFIRDDKKIIYGIKGLAKELSYGERKTRKLLATNKNINKEKHTYYKIENSPFI